MQLDVAETSCVGDRRAMPASARRALAALTVALLLAGPAQSQADRSASALAPSAMSRSTAVRPADEIVVTGKTDARPAEIRGQASAITRTSVKYHNPLAKFQDKLCPGVVGMPAEMAEIIVDRIRYNAERVGIETAPLGHCSANIMVIFVRNGQAVIKALRKKQDHIFRNISLADLKEMVADGGPVHVWNNTEVRSRQGDILQGDNDSDLTKIPTLNVAQSQSHIFLANRLDITNSVIMIDIPAIDGMGVVAIADYVTMRTFARTNPVKGDSAAATILSLFDPGNSARPKQLTDFDLAYLRTVYQGVDSLNAASKLASINSKLRKVQAEAQQSPKADE